jgi:hypothetical protein
MRDGRGTVQLGLLEHEVDMERLMLDTDESDPPPPEPQVTVCSCIPRFLVVLGCVCFG